MLKRMFNKENYEITEKVMKQKKAFYRHFWFYLMVTLWVQIWKLPSTENPWFIWPLIIWGIFVLWHFLNVFIFHKELQSDTMANEK